MFELVGPGVGGECAGDGILTETVIWWLRHRTHLLDYQKRL